MRRFRGSRGVPVWVAVLVVAACDPPTPDVPDAADTWRDVAMDDGLRVAISEGGAADDVRDPGGPLDVPVSPPTGCDPSAHVDCFGGFQCRGAGSVRACAHAPYPTCTHEEALAAYRADICCRDRGFQCPSGRCADTPVDERYRACVTALGMRGPNPDRAYMRLVCADALRRAGDRCSDVGCRPAADEPDLALACDRDAGACVRVARPMPQPGFGTPCGPGAPDAGDAARCPLCVPPNADCTRWRCTQRCTLDEDCPAGWDCNVNSECTGICVPRGRRATPPAAPCW